IDCLRTTRLHPNAADIAAVAHIRTAYVRANTDYNVGRANAAAGLKPQGRVVVPGGVIDQRGIPDGCVAVAGVVAKIDRAITNCRVKVAGGVALQREVSNGGV